MAIWQADFYKRPLKDNSGQILWELLICDTQGNIITSNYCPQSDINTDWLVLQLENLIQNGIPEAIEIFRPQSYNLFLNITERINIKVIPTRRTLALKQLLLQRAEEYHISGNLYNPLKLEKQVPKALPETLMGEKWNFCSILADDFVETFSDRPIPILNISESLYPLNLGLTSNTEIPGVIIYGGKQSLKLAQWIDTENPVSLNYIVTEIGESGGLILESGLDQRWIMATFSNSEFAQSANIYESRKQQAKGLHFLLIQPDDSGMTTSGLWLLLDDSDDL